MIITKRKKIRNMKFLKSDTSSSASRVVDRMQDWEYAGSTVKFGSRFVIHNPKVSLKRDYFSFAINATGQELADA